jgi:hypothetical protein
VQGLVLLRALVACSAFAAVAPVGQVAEPVPGQVAEGVGRQPLVFGLVAAHRHVGGDDSGVHRQPRHRQAVGADHVLGGVLGERAVAPGSQEAGQPVPPRWRQRFGEPGQDRVVAAVADLDAAQPAGVGAVQVAHLA